MGKRGIKNPVSARHPFIEGEFKTLRPADTPL